MFGLFFFFEKITGILTGDFSRWIILYVRTVLYCPIVYIFPIFICVCWIKRHMYDSYWLQRIKSNTNVTEIIHRFWNNVRWNVVFTLNCKLFQVHPLLKGSQEKRGRNGVRKALNTKGYRVFGIILFFANSFTNLLLIIVTTWDKRGKESSNPASKYQSWN